MDNYTEKKKRNQSLIHLIDSNISSSGVERVNNCGTYIEFYADTTLENKKIKKANFCGNRFCPMCRWRKARKDALQVAILMQYLKQEKGLEFVMMTLTAPNVPGENLKNEITRYNKNFKKLMKRKEFEKISFGYMRKLEVTYNQERNDFHPHFHVIIAVKKSYFHKQDYISKQRLLVMWQNVMNDDTITQVDIRKINASNQSAISEIAKYTAKDSDYMKSQEVFDYFYKALKRRQSVTYAGAFKEALKLYKDGLLDDYKEIDHTEYIYLLTFTWNRNFAEYIQYELRELDEYERIKINKKLIDELDID